MQSVLPMYDLLGRLRRYPIPRHPNRLGQIKSNLRQLRSLEPIWFEVLFWDQSLTHRASELSVLSSWLDNPLASSRCNPGSFRCWA
jgi:hypothetical protein